MALGAFQKSSLKGDDSAGKCALLHSLFFLLPAKNMEIMAGPLPISLDNKSTLIMKPCCRLWSRNIAGGFLPPNHTTSVFLIWCHFFFNLKQKFINLFKPLVFSIIFRLGKPSPVPGMSHLSCLKSCCLLILLIHKADLGSHRTSSGGKFLSSKSRDSKSLGLEETRKQIPETKQALQRLLCNRIVERLSSSTHETDI